MKINEAAAAAEDRDRCQSLERDTTRRQPFLWRKALNDDDDAAFWLILATNLHRRSPAPTFRTKTVMVCP